MSNINIEVGKTEDHRHIGIQPPLTDEQKTLLGDAEFMDADVRSDFHTIQTPDMLEPYSHMEAKVSEFGTADEADEGAVRTAEKIANLFRRNGESVTVNPRIRNLDAGEILFDNTTEPSFPFESGEIISTEIELSQDGLEEVIERATDTLGLVLHSQGNHMFQRSPSAAEQKLIARVVTMCEVLDDVTPIPGGSWYKLIQDRAMAISVGTPPAQC